MTKNPDDEARLAYALIKGLSFEDGLKMIQDMFKVDEMGACELIVRGQYFASQNEGTAA
jgi:hypothetical protein